MPSRYVNLSHAAAGKRVYKYENSDERMVDMIVSNGTPLRRVLRDSGCPVHQFRRGGGYRGHQAQASGPGRVRNSQLLRHRLCPRRPQVLSDILHEGPASLFEIPLAYYASLPTASALWRRSPHWWRPWSRPSATSFIWGASRRCQVHPVRRAEGAVRAADGKVSQDALV